MKYNTSLQDAIGDSIPESVELAEESAETCDLVATPLSRVQTPVADKCDDVHSRWSPQLQEMPSIATSLDQVCTIHLF